MGNTHNVVNFKPQVKVYVSPLSPGSLSHFFWFYSHIFLLCLPLLSVYPHYHISTPTTQTAISRTIQAKAEALSRNIVNQEIKVFCGGGCTEERQEQRHLQTLSFWRPSSTWPIGSTVPADGFEVASTGALWICHPTAATQVLTEQDYSSLLYAPGSGCRGRLRSESCAHHGLWAAPSGWALPVYRRISTQFYLPVAQLLGVQGTQWISIHFRTQSRSSHSVFKLSASLLCHFVKSSPHLRQPTHHLHGTDHAASTHNLTVHLGLA